jgi:KDO2-lipid IV(A) lauroyltransferase
MVLLSGHFGSWQIAVYPVGIRLGGFHLVARPPDNPHIAADATRIRERFGNTEVERGGSAHRMLNIVRKGNALGLVVDQRPPSGGIVVPFMGHPARATPIPAMVSIFAKAPAVPLTCVPVGADRYRLTMKPAIQPEGRGDEAVARLTERYLAEAEADVRSAPEMWLWMHRRWAM